MRSTKLLLQTDRAVLTILGPESASMMLRYVSDNREHLEQWEQEQYESYYSFQSRVSDLMYYRNLYERGEAFRFVALNKAQNEVLGICEFSHVMRGAFQSCHLGYSLAEKYQGQGLMYEILKAGLQYVFEQEKLHRVVANYMPHNKRSAALLQRLGFEKEGYAKSYLKVAGCWEDHVLTAKINPQSCDD